MGEDNGGGENFIRCAPSPYPSPTQGRGNYLEA